MSTDGLVLRGVAGVRGGRTLFSDLDLALAPGELLHLRGANGAGKTSLLRMLCGLLTPAAGEVRWQGRPITALREEFNRQLVYVGHAAALKDDLSALENLLVAALLGGHRPTRREAALALGAAGLRGRELVAARHLSQGQRRRVALARLALGTGAPLWVLDEPFNALDTAATDWLLGLIGEQLARRGIVILTSHQPLAIDAAWPQRSLTL